MFRSICSQFVNDQGEGASEVWLERNWRTG